MVNQGFFRYRCESAVQFVCETRQANERKSDEQVFNA